MSEPFIGQITVFGGNFAPRSYAQCDGQLLAIAQNSALFSILGTTYGGDGRTSFGLPELRGRVAVHQGNGPGLSPVRLGQKGGVNSQTLTANNLPPAPVSIPSANVSGSSNQPNGNIPAQGIDANTGAPVPSYTDSANSDGALAGAAIQGGGQSFSVMPPFLGLNWLIALQGVFPSRN